MFAGASNRRSTSDCRLISLGCSLYQRYFKRKKKVTNDFVTDEFFLIFPCWSAFFLETLFDQDQFLEIL